MADLGKIKGTIAQLLAKANDQGASEAEALSAMNAASKLMEKHGVTADDVAASKQEDFEKRTIQTGRIRRHEVDCTCNGAISRFCDVKCWYTHGEVGGQREWSTVFFGYRPDVEMAEWLRETIKQAMDAEWARFKMRYGSGVGRERSNFYKGMGRRICIRLMELAIERHGSAERAHDGRELVVAKDAAVDAAFDALRMGSMGAAPRIQRPRDGIAFRAGDNAGKRTALGRPVSVDQGPLRIAAQ